ncbi:MAG TPA: class I SAM-dependent methyltransferase [Polyangiaceae bacterium]|nr:class I SAM-dependent methyltransferase [Polyangiaceae bacterium]
MNVRLDAARRYLDVRYSERERPYTDYPGQLTAYLTEQYLTARRGETLLDLGCGRGEFLNGFAQLGFAATGFDRSRPAQPRFNEPVVEGDYEQGGLPFGDGQFSVVFNKSVFEHVRDISPLLRECHRVLAPGGRMVSLVPDWTAQWRHFYDDWTHVRPFTLVGLRECIQSHGFEVREAVRFRQLPLLWERPYLRPLSDAAALLPDAFKRSKFVRFSKEWMLLVVADRVG